MGRPDPERLVRSGDHPALGPVVVRPYGRGFALVDVRGPAEVSLLRAALERHHPATRPRPGWSSVLLACHEPAQALDLVLGLPIDGGDLAVGEGATHVVDVRYDGADLTSVADLVGLSADEVVARHTEPVYRVVFLGFTRGFPYLMGLHPALAGVPRLATPRVRVPAGSVGIAAGQAGVYPMDSPGGWQLLGHTQAPLFDERRSPPGSWVPGDAVRFRAV